MARGELGELDLSLPRLNLGCGADLRPGYVNHDFRPRGGVEVVHDLNSFPWPWAANTFEEIYASHVLEHLFDRLRTLEEIWRIGAPGAIVDIWVPDASHPEMWTDPTHRSAWRLGTLDYFLEGHPFSFYTPARFEILVRHYDGGRIWLHWRLKIVKEEAR